LVGTCGDALFGVHPPQQQFPLLFKFLDANQVLSVQVHPSDAAAAQLDPPDLGKTEAWVVIHAEPGSILYAGLHAGVDRPAFERAIAAGTTASCLHGVEVHQGDCIFIPAGTVHAIGAGLVVAEIQQSSDVTYRLHDWNRTGPDGKPRPLHLEAGLEAVSRFGPVDPTPLASTSSPEVRRLATCDYFVFDEVTPGADWSVGGDDTCHLLAIVGGRVALDEAWGLPELGPGRTVLLPAEIGPQTVRCVGNAGEAKLLHVALG
jgi:mannose-6-phosphate isomerase